MAEQQTTSSNMEYFKPEFNLGAVPSSANLSEHSVNEDFFSRHYYTAPENIPLYYKDSSIFMTGVTGFLGKSILEKLLRSCPDIDKIFVLVRSKKGQSPQQRVEDLFKSKLFDRAQTEQGAEKCREKVVAIAGDVQESNLGISLEDEQMLMSSNVTTVIHSAATIRFDEPLRFALELNVGGTQKVVQLCRKLQHLKALVHVSTAYANCDLPYIEEKVYPPPVDPHKLLDALDWMTDEAASKITPVLIGNKPNTYTYTKHLAENLLVEEAGDSLPYIIVRPSIVGASWKEPFPGWIDNFNGPSGLFIACGMGLLRTVIGKPDAIADIVPVDIVSNVIVAAPWYRANVLGNQYASESNSTNPARTIHHSVSNPKLVLTPNNNTTCTPPAQPPFTTSSCVPPPQLSPKTNNNNCSPQPRTTTPVPSILVQQHTSTPENAVECHSMTTATGDASGVSVITTPTQQHEQQQTPSPSSATTNNSSSNSSSPEDSSNQATIATNSCEASASSSSADAADTCSLSSIPNSTTEDEQYLEMNISPSQRNLLAPPPQIILNCTSGYADKPALWGNVCQMVADSFLEVPIQGAVRYPSCEVTNNKMMYFLWAFTCHRVPAVMMDLYMRLVGKKPRMLSMYRKIHRSMDTLAFFTSRHWEWEVKSLRHMQQMIEAQTTTSSCSTSDKNSIGGTTGLVDWGKEWNTSVKSIDWPEYLGTFCMGTKCFVLNEDLSEVHLAKQKMSRLKTLHYVFNIFTAAIFWKVITLKSEVASKMWNMLVRFCFKWLETMRISRFVTL